MKGNRLRLTNLLMLTLAGIINAFGITVFLMPVNLYDSGATYLDAKGGYSNQEKSMIYFVVNRYQVVRMKELVHDIDPMAYITISEVADVFSNNNQ